MYGYDVPWGDGALYLDNWSNGYVWFSTCGRVEYKYSSDMIDDLITDVCYNVNDNPYDAYCTYVNSLSNTMEAKLEIPLIIFVPMALIAAIIYLIVGLVGNKGKKTTKSTTYVQGGRANFLENRDIFVTKHTTSRKIDTSSSSSSGGGGHHVSSGGHSHGGGGGRH